MSNSITPTPADIVRVAQSLKGVPWKHQGRSRAGVDCLGFIILVATEAGLKHGIDFNSYEFRSYRRLPTQLLLKGMRKYLKQVKAIEPGRIGLFAQDETIPYHVGVFCPDNMVIHCDLMHYKKVIGHRLDDEWRHSVVGVFCYPGMD